MYMWMLELQLLCKGICMGMCEDGGRAEHVCECMVEWVARWAW